ncbi:MAG: GspE/PulE family protein [Candidatus Omnitrophica bacterium]|nr:GspE/PulE family protein [Candidatus Omnitrophota bacterium]MBU1048341.1 GspE/PulE family protein [Candidatus Omnitrophota bacterium]MBU1630910.1 GspE/PulE family protein [Candidatus Omnitrophota bacterium]MBU1766944.1 GspE/PulE family protein [Candidatus Omnitrophota bacterium]MBU1889677.1 GspE/PulE family protein [Candidatus Omnitrophota bacterium]
MGKREQQIFRDTLINMGLVNEEQLEIALKEQQNTGDRLGDILVRLEFISREALTKALASHFGLIPINLKEYNPPKKVVNLVPAAVARRYKLLPLKLENEILTIALADPLDFLSLDNLEKTIGYKINPVLAKEQDMESKLTQHYGVSEETLSTLVTEISESNLSIAGLEGESIEETGEDAPIIKFVSMLILEAFKARASDIHVEPLINRLRMRYRIDGILHEIQAPPKKIQPSVLSRIKLLAGMKIEEKRLPQDGRILVTIMGKTLDLRVSALPSIHGESIVMRILDKSSLLLGLGELGFIEEDQKKWSEVIKTTNGIILVTGPTGSGKTTSLYAVLNELNTPDKKIITVEDPVEYQLSGINQVPVNPQIDLTFANALRSILRQAPDVILVGEIRDTETAEIAVRAALTGHLVFSTLHTNDSASALTRLIDMGVKPFLVSSSVQAILAQRLVRTICKKCIENYQPPVEILKMIEQEMGAEILKTATFKKGRGCEQCNNSGYKGRLGIYELLVMSEKIRDLVLEQIVSRKIRDLARQEGMKLLREDGWIKVCRGITTAEEVISNTQSDVVDVEE